MRIRQPAGGIALFHKAPVLGGVIAKTAEGKPLFPYDAVRVEFLLQAAWTPSARASSLGRGLQGGVAVG